MGQRTGHIPVNRNASLGQKNSFNGRLALALRLRKADRYADNFSIRGAPDQGRKIFRQTGKNNLYYEFFSKTAIATSKSICYLNPTLQLTAYLSTFLRRSTGNSPYIIRDQQSKYSLFLQSIPNCVPTLPTRSLNPSAPRRSFMKKSVPRQQIFPLVSYKSPQTTQDLSKGLALVTGSPVFRPSLAFTSATWRVPCPHTSFVHFSS